MDRRDDLSAGGNVLVHFLFLGGFTRGRGQPLLFPSLGPPAYLLPTGEDSRTENAYDVIGGHAIAAGSGPLAFTLFADWLVAIDVFERGARRSADVALLALTAIVSMVLTGDDVSSGRLNWLY